MKKAGYLLALVVLSLAFVFPPPTLAQGAATVSIVAPAEVVAGSTFSARVNINNVTNLNAWNYDVVFNKSVLEVAGVLGGEVGGMPIQPGENQWVVSNGTLKVVADIPGISTVSGSGYLAEIQFKVIGEIGDTSAIDLRSGILSSDLASSIPATWGRATVVVVAPTISINPVEGCQGKKLKVEISGKGLTGTTDVSFGDGMDVAFKVDSDVRITATLTIAADAAVGVRNVSVTTTAGTQKLFDAFTVKMSPTITSVSPDGGKRSRILDVVIKGTNFAAVTKENVSFGEGITVNDIVVKSDTEITARITIASDAKGGARDVSVNNAVECSGVKAGGFTVLGGVPIWAIALIIIAIGIAVYFGIRWRRRRRAMGMS